MLLIQFIGGDSPFFFPFHSEDPLVFQQRASDEDEDADDDIDEDADEDIVVTVAVAVDASAGAGAGADVSSRAIFRSAP